MTICHATSSPSNPYVMQTVDTASIIGTRGHASHTGGVFTPGMTKGWGDIIPAFTGFAGLNASAGAAILANNCKLATNQAPVVELAAVDAPTNKEGSTITVTGAFRDPDGDALTLTANNGTVGTFTDHGNGSWTYSRMTDDDVAPTTVTVTAKDAKGATVSDDFSYAAQNVDPSNVAFTVTSADSYGCSVTASMKNPGWVDPGTADTWTTTFAFGNSTANSSSTHTFTSAGTPSITASVTDDDGGVGSASLTHRVFNRPEFDSPEDAFVTLVIDNAPKHKSGSTIPLRLGLEDCTGQITSAPSGDPLLVHYAAVNADGSTGAFVAASSSESSMALRTAFGFYTYTFDTTGFAAGTYRIRVSGGALRSDVTEDVVVFVPPKPKP